MDWSLGFGLFLASFLAAIAALWLFALARPGRPAASTLFADVPGGTVFLFDDDTLVDATESARALLATSPGTGTPWDRLLAFAGPRFVDFETRIENLPATGRVTIVSPGAEPLTLIAEWRGGLRRIAILDPHVEGQVPMIDSLSQRAQDEELQALRETADGAPFPIWRENAGHGVVWANSAYLALAAQRDEDTGGLSWPLPRLFAPTGDGGTRRLCLTLPDGEHWFDRLVTRRGEERLVFALPADIAVRAEVSLRSFMQTLAKTFAHLPIGLAIFDRRRQLQMFNPALTDLTSLPVDFLSARPVLYAFLDALRDRHMLPEPRDYKTWRLKIASMDPSQPEGFEETWALPGGLTYRVTGRPHPEGALALLFQDISDEVTRSRRYRADLELGQSVIDAMDEAIAVFAPGGTLVMSNAAYAALWADDPGASLAEGGAAATVAHWRTRALSDPLWDRAEGFINGLGPREDWAGTVLLADGRALACRFRALAGRATLAGFRAGEAAALPLADPARPIRRRA